MYHLIWNQQIPNIVVWQGIMFDNWPTGFYDFVVEDLDNSS